MKTTQLLQKLQEQGLPNPRLLQTLPRYHSGWEGDAQIWVTGSEDNQTHIYTTEHGKLCLWKPHHIEEYLKELQTHLKMVEKILPQHTAKTN